MDLVSQCALRVAKVVWRPGHGGVAFTVVCKATFELSPELSLLAAVQEPVAVADWYFGEAGALAFASELVPVKKRPEVLLTGHAYAPEGRSTPSLLARLVVGEIDKTVQVVGDRHFLRDGRLSEPEAFTRMPLGWERASVGPDASNPAGKPPWSSAQPDLLGRVPAPNLLPAGLQLASRSEVVPAVGFGPIAPLWPSRAACLGQRAAGWDPGRWHEQPLPADIDLGYFNAAPADQQRSLPFGEEAIYLENLHPRFGRLSTRLSPVMLAATVDHGAGPQALSLRCDTLILDTDRGTAMLVWRAHVLLDSLDRPGRVVVTAPGAARLNTMATQLPSALLRSTPVLPFSADAVVAPAPAVPARGEVASPPLDEESCSTMGPGFVIPAAVLPFLAAQREIASRRAAPSVDGASDLPFLRAEPAAPVAQPLAPPSDIPAPPPMIGPIAVVAAEIQASPDSDAPVATEDVEIAIAAPIEVELEIDFAAHPPSRCGGIAARLACAGGDEARAGEILRVADLDATRWQRVHAHWLARIREEVARSRKKLLSDYDGAYVEALESERGPIALDEYARLAEAAERGEIPSALAEGGLPEGAWPRIHRVWIGRMVKDARLARQARSAIAARRGAG